MAPQKVIKPIEIPNKKVVDNIKLNNIQTNRSNNNNIHVNQAKDYNTKQSNVPVKIAVDSRDYVSHQVKNVKNTSIRNRMDQLNPNFRKINEMPEGRESNNPPIIKIEIYEPKKKPQASVDKVLVMNNNLNNNGEKKFNLINNQLDKK